MKKQLSKFLKHIKLITEDFNGHIVIHITKGNVGTIDITTTIR